MRLPRRPVLLLVMVAPVLIMPACDYIRSSVDPNLRLKVKREPPPSGLNCIDNVRLVDQTTQQEFCVLRTPDPTQQQTQLTCHTGPVTPSTSCDCGQDCGLTPGRKKRESERITGGSNVTGSCVHPWQVSLTMNVKSAVGRLLKLIEVYKEKLQVDITCPSCPSPPLGQITWYQYLTRELGAIGGYEHYCGGTIISPNYAITAAQCLFWSRGIPDIRNWCVPPFTVCFENLQLPEHLIWGLLFGGLHIPLLPEEIILLAGVNDLKTANNINMALFNSFKYDVEGIKIHEKYNQFLQDVNAEFKEYDIAILTVKTPFRISNTVRPVCLPSSPTRDYTNEPAMATGFGDGTPLPLDQGSGEHLKKANLKVVSTADCNTKWKAVRSDPNSYSHGPHDTLNYQNQDAIKGYYFLILLFCVMYYVSIMYYICIYFFLLCACKSNNTSQAWT